MEVRKSISIINPSGGKKVNVTKKEIYVINADGQEQVIQNNVLKIT
jgi:hypothetical protein